MLLGFEEITPPLTANEEKRLLPMVVYLISKSDKKNWITAKRICAILNEGFSKENKKNWIANNKYGLESKVVESRVVACVHQIRVRGLLVTVMATSKGYCYSPMLEDANSTEESLRQRARAVLENADGVKNYKGRANGIRVLIEAPPLVEGNRPIPERKKKEVNMTEPFNKVVLKIFEGKGFKLVATNKEFGYYRFLIAGTIINAYYKSKNGVRYMVYAQTKNGQKEYNYIAPNDLQNNTIPKILSDLEIANNVEEIKKS